MKQSRQPPIPRLRTQRLWLRAMELRDAADVFDYARDPAVLRYTTGITPTHLSETKVFLEASLRDASNYWWAIRVQDDGPVIGAIDCGLHPPDAAHIDYAMGALYWGQGLMTEAVGAVSAWAFAAFPTIVRLQSAVVVDNFASCGVLEKCGFVRIGETTEPWTKQDAPVRLWRYERARTHVT
jgi:[ribosomal protein S5]-alanine N-acetyltransferase